MPNNKSLPEPETVAQQDTGGDCVPRLVRLSLSFQPYEVELILDALSQVRHQKLTRCPWVKQEGGGYGWTPSREVRRLRFVENSIRRQLSEPNDTAQTTPKEKS
jgi:hypothetical protein